MSRFVKRLDKLPPVARDKLWRDKTKHTMLPTMDPPRYVSKKDKNLTMEQIGITKGDYIYINEGESKGKITKVLEYHSRTNEFAANDISKPLIVAPQYWAENQKSHLIDFPRSIPREHVKLAAREKDENGNITHVVANEVVYKGQYYDDRYKRWLPRRFVKHHENLEIPWPTPDKNHTASEVTTKEEVAHLKTYETQTIAKSLLPPGVLNEIRNPYSKHKKQELTDIEARRLNEPAMPLTTEQKIYLAKKAKEPKKKLEPLSEEVKDYIGQRMAQHISKIESPHLLAHLDALSKVEIPDFKRTLEKIEEDQQSNTQ